jgi:N-acetylmuramoyl-L-alanine amidase
MKAFPKHKDRGLKIGNALAVLKGNSKLIPSALVECEFISNPSIEEQLKERSYQDKVAKAIVQGIVGYYKG